MLLSYRYFIIELYQQAHLGAAISAAISPCMLSLRFRLRQFIDQSSEPRTKLITDFELPFTYTYHYAFGPTPH
jgi:hypothetical protein